MLVVANGGETDLAGDTDLVKKVRAIAAEKGGEVVVICGELEAQIAQLPPEERREFMREMGLPEPGLDVLIRAAYKLLGLETFFTAGPKEARAWTIHRGSRAPQAAGVSLAPMVASEPPASQGPVAEDAAPWAPSRATAEGLGKTGWPTTPTTNARLTIAQMK